MMWSEPQIRERLVSGSCFNARALSCSVSVAAVTGLNSKVTNELHPAKAPSPMLMTVLGIVMVANELHPEKALLPMLATLSGIVTLVNELHPWKAWIPIVLTRRGIVVVRNELHPLKEQYIMMATVSGIVTVSTISLSTPHHESSQSSSESYGDTISVIPSGKSKWCDMLVVLL